MGEMSTTSIVGSGSTDAMNYCFVTTGGQTFEMTIHDPTLGRAPAKQIVASPTPGAFGAIPARQTFVQAIFYSDVTAVRQGCSEGLAGKLPLAITNLVASDNTNFMITAGCKFIRRLSIGRKLASRRSSRAPDFGGRISGSFPWSGRWSTSSRCLAAFSHTRSWPLTSHLVSPFSSERIRGSNAPITSFTGAVPCAF